MSVVTGHPDWLPAIAVVDQPALLTLILNQGVPHTSTPIDVRRWASFQLAIQYEAANAGPPANTGIVTIEWGDTAGFNNVLARHVYEINSANSTDCGRSVITDGMYGPFMRLTLGAGNGAGSTFTAVMYGSNRPYFQTRAGELATVHTRGMSSDRHILIHADNIPASGVDYRNARLGVGVATIMVRVAGTGGPISVLVHSPQLGIVGGQIYNQLAVASGTTLIDRITIPRRVQAVQLVNSSGANAVTVRVTITMDND